MRLRATHAAQALVETAIALTLIFFLLVGALDVGLIFLDLQGLHSAAQEGASYGSRFLKVESLNVAHLDKEGIRQRVRFVSGDTGGINFVNMLDLNSDGILDVTDSDGDGILDTPQINPATGRPVIEDYILVEAVEDVNRDGDPSNDPDGVVDEVPGGGDRNTLCPSLTDPNRSCYVRVVVRADHNIVFPIVVFGKQVPLSSTFYMPIRAGFVQVGAPTFTPVLATNTPTSTPTASNTPVPPTATFTPVPPTATFTPPPATNTATNTATRTNTPTRTNTSTPTNTATRTNTPTPSNTPTMTPTPCPAGNGTGLRGSYILGNDPSRAPVFNRLDSTINFNWGTTSPGAGMPSSNWSAVWTGQVQPRFSQEYTFITNSDDGIRVWVNNSQVINSWQNQNGSTPRTGTISLVACQKYNIRIEYYQGGGGSLAKLQWRSASQAEQVIPASQLYPGNPQATATPTRTSTPSSTPLPTNTPTRTSTPTRTNTPTITLTPSRTPTRTNTPTPSNTLTPSLSPTRTNTPLPTNTRTPTLSPTRTNTPLPTNTATRTSTPPPTNTVTPTNTPVPTSTPTPSNTPTITPRPTRSGT
jgi:hypothetical protein